MEVRKLTVSDGAGFQKVRLQALKECSEAFGSSYEEECTWDKSIYENKIKSGQISYFGAFVDNNMVGIIGLTVNTRRKTSHRASIISFFVCPDFRGQGIGRKLLFSVIEEASAMETVEQIELSVVTKQLAAIELYKGLAFQIYGEESRSLKVNGCYYDEFLMMKKLH
jgi:ribosomal protein S18 acetylase RimI-like enzyme